MRMYSPSEEEERLLFAQEAAKCFESRPEVRTFTNSGNIDQGELFAVRWGMDADCVVVFKVDEYIEPINYQNIVESKAAKRHTKLTASAPELLEALKELMGSDLCDREIVGKEKKRLPEYEMLIHKCRQAVNKAEGR